MMKDCRFPKIAASVLVGAFVMGLGMSGCAQADGPAKKTPAVSQPPTANVSIAPAFESASPGLNEKEQSAPTPQADHAGSIASAIDWEKILSSTDVTDTYEVDIPRVESGVISAASLYDYRLEQIRLTEEEAEREFNEAGTQMIEVLRAQGIPEEDITRTFSEGYGDITAMLAGRSYVELLTSPLQEASVILSLEYENRHDLDFDGISEQIGAYAGMRISPEVLADAVERLDGYQDAAHSFLFMGLDGSTMLSVSTDTGSDAGVVFYASVQCAPAD